MNQFQHTVKSLISSNKIKLALVILSEYCKDKDNESYNQCLMQLSVLNETEKNFLLGIVRSSEAAQNLAKVRYASMTLVDELAQKIDDDAGAQKLAMEMQATFSERELEIPNQNQNRVFLFASIGLLGFLAILMFLFFQKKESAPKTAPLPAVQKIDTTLVVEALSNEIDQYYDQRNYSKCLTALNKAIELRSDNADFYNTRASVYFQLDKLDMASADAQRSALLDPENCFVYATLAQIASRRHDTEKFYDNLEISLRKRCPIWDYTQLPGIVEHSNEKRFTNLLESYKKD